MTRLLHFGAITLLAAAEVQLVDGLFGPYPPLEIARFSSARAFENYLEGVRARQRRQTATEASNEAVYDLEAPPPPESEPPGIEGPAVEQSLNELPQSTGNPSITNNQTVGVDEGGIVKQIGRFLVVLQDGRLFSADLGAGEGAPLRLADRITVYRSREQAADWYDEMLVHEDRILVTAYNYREGASEISVMRIGPEGQLRREGRFLLDSNDYYSTENYSTRLVGDSLVFYAPVALAAFGADQDQPFEFPRIRRARGDGEADAGEALVGPADIYAPPGEIDSPVLHTVSICPLRDDDLDCRTTAFIGASSREIYVTPTDAFLWLGAPDGLPWAIEYANRRRTKCRDDEFQLTADDQLALVYRVPLDGSAIGAIAVDGYPVDQFALDSRDGRFRALLTRPRGHCLDSIGRQPLALVDLPLEAFGASLRPLADAAYRPLPQIEGHQLENRFLGDWLLYGGVKAGPPIRRSRKARPGRPPCSPSRSVAPASRCASASPTTRCASSAPAAMPSSPAMGAGRACLCPM